MRILGLLVRTRNDQLTEIGFPYADEILNVSREQGHIFIDIAAEMATKENVLRILKGIGCPKGPFLKLVVFYCHANENSPIDQNGQDFITEGTVSVFNGWGVYCIGCDVARTLSHSLLAAGADFLIAFNSAVMVVLPHADEIYAGLNSGIIRMLREGVEPLAATEHMRQFFLDSITRVDNSPSVYSLLRKMALRSHAKALEYHGSKRREDHPAKDTPVSAKIEIEPPVPNIGNNLSKIKTGQKQAAEYQRLVAKILHETFSPQLDEPHLEVSNESGASRYDIVFMNRADRGFWHDIKFSRGNSIVIFDAKNKNELSPSDADQMLRYSSPWRGNVIFLVCRNTPSKAFTTRSADLLKEKGVCLIVLSDRELEEIYSLKQKGSDPTIVIERLYRDRIERA
jgi:hypothetical protein